MKYKMTYAWIVIATLLSTATLSAKPTNQNQCINNEYDRSFFNQLKTNNFQASLNASDDKLALLLSNCLGNPDPKLRDGIAYEGLTTLLRGNRVSNETKHQLLKKYYAILKSAHPDPKGFLKPFVALSLAEVARTDRIKAFLNQQQRIELVNVAANYLISISDYRGFNEVEGWRHGVAHGADLLMQLSLNNQLTKKEHWTILHAISKQATQSQHAYTFGEPTRLARPVLFIASENSLNDKQWQDFFNQVIEIQPLLNNWDEIYSSETGLIKHHNVKAFLTTLYLNASHTQNKKIKKILPHILEAIKSIP